MSSPLPPKTPGYFSDNPFASPTPIDTGRRGMVNQVRVVAVLNIVQGFLELLMAVMMLGMAGFFFAMREQIIAEDPDPDTELGVNVMAGFFAVIGILPLASSVLRIIAGAMNIGFRGRVLAIVSMIVGLAPAITGYCAPTAIAMAVYGLIVLFNREVTEAFQMRSEGRSAEEILRYFNSRPY